MLDPWYRPPDRPATVPETAHWVELPFTEVCMHLCVAGKWRWVAPVGTQMAQIYDEDGLPFSAPVTAAEAGIIVLSGVRYV